GFQFSRGYNPRNPAAVVSPNFIDPNLTAPTTDEIIGGVEHELLPAFAVGFNYTYRKFKDFVWQYTGSTSLGHIFDPNTGRIMTTSDYQLDRILTGTLPDETAYSVPTYTLKPSVVAAIGRPSGNFIHNRNDFDETYSGFELVLNKRLSNKWMMRGNFVYNINKQHAGTAGCIDPTNILNTSTIAGASCADNDYVAVQSTGSGSKGSVFLTSKWQFNVVGMSQLPLGFNVAGNVYGRQGYPILWFRRVSGSTDGFRRDVVVTTADDQRYKNVYEVDLRLE